MLGGMGKLFKSLVNDATGKQDEKPVLPEIAGLRIGGTVDLDLLAARMHADEMNFEAAEDTRIIVAQGLLDLEDGAHVARYYFRDDTMLQLLLQDGLTEHHLQEITYFQPWDSRYPANRADWQRWFAANGPIGHPEYVIDGVHYERLWFQDDGWSEPVSFHERVYSDRTGLNYDDIQQHAMLYGRNVGTGDMGEYLLVAAEDADDGEPTIELMVGIDIAPGQMNVL